jgi:hypothetical protein
MLWLELLGNSKFCCQNLVAPQMSITTIDTCAMCLAWAVAAFLHDFAAYFPLFAKLT